MSIVEEIDRALECMGLVNEDDDHGGDEGCFWCGFDVEDGQVPNLLRRAKVALAAQAQALAELRAMKERATYLLGSYAHNPPKSDFDRIALAVARFIRDGEANVGEALDGFLKHLAAGKVEGAQ